MNNIKKAEEYLQLLFDKSDYYKNNLKEKEYRLNHTFRVANIGKEIAVKENLNVEAVVIGCLLHDISYIESFQNKEDWINHGRRSAVLAREFVGKLHIEDYLKEEILFGIAIHVDDEAGFDGNKTILAETIGEADNIDRFDMYRLYQSLLDSNLISMTLDEQKQFIENKIVYLSKLKELQFKTITSNNLWNEKLDFQIEFFKRLLRQLKQCVITI
jgi:uncharacterized protein